MRASTHQTHLEEQVHETAAAEADAPGQEVETTTEAADAQRDQDATTTETDGSEVLKDPEFDNNKK